MSLLVASLYLLCLALLLGSAAFVLARDPRGKLNRRYALLALSLLGWVGTLFVFEGLPEGRALLAVGRANFAAAAVVATASYLFVAELAGRRPQRLGWLAAEALLQVALSLLTPLIDAGESVRGGQHVTAYGPLFPLYALHIVGLLAASVALALRPGAGVRSVARAQLRLVGTGILATAVVGVVANIVLPYGLGDFRFIGAGALSTILLLVAVGYAVFAHHLFDVHVIVRKTFVYAGLVAVMLEVYHAAVAFLARLLPLGDPSERAHAAAAVALVVNAFTQEALRRWLERLVDRLWGATLKGRRSHIR